MPAWLNDQLFGAVLASAFVLVPAPLAAWVIARGWRRPRAKLALVGSGVLLAALAALNVYAAVFPGEAIYTGRLGASERTAQLGSVRAGTYTLLLEGQLPERAGEVTLPYQLTLSNAGRTEALAGELWRRLDPVRVGRGAQATIAHSQSAARHAVWLSEGQTDLRLESDPQGALTFTFYRAWLPPLAFWLVAALLFVIGTFLDAKFGADSVRAAVPMAFAATTLFAWQFPQQVAHAALVRGAFGSALIALFGGIFAGGACASLARRGLKR